jgi:hypothetical protein
MLSLPRCRACVRRSFVARVVQYYRIGGACRKCPNNPWLLIGGFFLAIIGVAILGYILNRKSVNVAFLSIGVDYFQVLAMFARSNVKWPPDLQKLYLAMSAFNFNIDITAPECAIPVGG